MKKSSLAVVIGAAMSAATVVCPTMSMAQDQGSTLSIYENLDLFSRAFELVRNNYVEEIGVTEITRGAIEGMLSSLDPHSGYLTPQAMDRTEERSSGEFGGLGIEITMENGWVKIISPIDDTPAAKAGLQAGDFITEINGTTVLGMTLEEAVKDLRGPVGSTVVITIEREGEDSPLEVSITREIIQIASTKVRVVDDALILRLTKFDQQTLPSMIDAVEEQTAEAGGLENFSGIILDLRNNPGGLLSAAVDISDAFLDSGEIVSVRGRGQRQLENYEAVEGDLAEGMPIVALINGGSASGSEIVAGALQDHGRAVVVGTPSFGKGSVQTIINLGEGRGGVRMTTARYYTPSGRSIQAQGITPDITLARTTTVESAEAEYIKESDLRNSLENDSLMNVSEEEEDEQDEDMLAYLEIRGTDSQLAFAIDFLKGLQALER